MSKTILITGSSTGIGKETALYFASKGWNVVATMRNIEKANDLLVHKNIKVTTLDVHNEISIKNAIEESIKHFGNIDVIFNNAGYALAGAFEGMTQEQIKAQFDTNLFGVMNVTKAILPHFRENKNGIIINTSSMAGLITFPTWSIYNSTKWALEGFMESLQFELRPFNIKVKNIEPGAIKTDFTKNIQTVSMLPYDSYLNRAKKNMMNTYKNAPEANAVAIIVFQAANDNSFRLRYTINFQSSVLLFIRWILPNQWFFNLVRLATERGN
jgi:NAD(P)-dependent dehydrogenase (short-subunit alcohol dehydrogenase family)